MISDLVQSYLKQKKLISDLERWKAKTLKHEEWDQARKINNFKAGMKLDARDKEQIWCRAEVVKSIFYANSPELLLIHYEVHTKFNIFLIGMEQQI